MSRIVAKIVKDKTKDKRQKIAGEKAVKHRYISSVDYTFFKYKKHCQKCKQELIGRPEIHHRVAVCDGGSNKRNNLIAVCKKCHKELDMEQIKARKTKGKENEML